MGENEEEEVGPHCADCAKGVHGIIRDGRCICCSEKVEEAGVDVG